MDECKGQPPAAAPTAAAAAAERAEDSQMKDVDQTTAASSSSNAAAVFLSRLLPARAEAAECDICNEALESSEATGAEAAQSRLPRMLPCGHSCCTSCIQKGLDANHGLLKCPQCGGFDPPQRLSSALKLSKNFSMIKMIEALADHDVDGRAVRIAPPAMRPHAAATAGQELNLMESEVSRIATELQASVDCLRNDFEQHRQRVTQGVQQVAAIQSALVPLRQATQRVQQSDDFDANLQFAQLQRDLQPLHVQFRQAVLDSRRTFGLECVRQQQAWLSLAKMQRQSLILDVDMTAKLALFCKGLMIKPSLLFRASRDGFELKDWKAYCTGKGPTLTLVTTADGSHVFGAYTHCSWPAADDTVVADPSGKSFLFSLVNADNQPVRFSLRDKDHAIHVTRYGVMFGQEKGQSDVFSNLCLMFNGRAANQGKANFVCDFDKPLSAYQADGGKAINENFVAGSVYFAATEIEVFQM